MNTADPVHFTLTPPECSMEMRTGYALNGPRVSGPVRVGDPLTLIINMRSNFGEKNLTGISADNPSDTVALLYSL